MGRVLGMGGGSSPNLTNGAAHVNPLPGPSTLAQNRMLVDISGSYSAATHSAQWGTGANITYLTILAMPHNGVTVAEDEYLLVTIDAANDTEAEANLGSSGDPPESTTANAQFIAIPIRTPVSIPLETAMVNGGGGGRVDVRVIGGVNLDVFIGAN